jgi:hypothetical protein
MVYSEFWGCEMTEEELEFMSMSDEEVFAKIGGFHEISAILNKNLLSYDNDVAHLLGGYDEHILDRGESHLQVVMSESVNSSVEQREVTVTQMSTNEDKALYDASVVVDEKTIVGLGGFNTISDELLEHSCAEYHSYAPSMRKAMDGLERMLRMSFADPLRLFPFSQLAHDVIKRKYPNAVVVTRKKYCNRCRFVVTSEDHERRCRVAGSVVLDFDDWPDGRRLYRVLRARNDWSRSKLGGDLYERLPLLKLADDTGVNDGALSIWLSNLVNAEAQTKRLVKVLRRFRPDNKSLVEFHDLGAHATADLHEYLYFVCADYRKVAAEITGVMNFEYAEEFTIQHRSFEDILRVLVDG